jgi:hypothetical protein
VIVKKYCPATNSHQKPFYEPLLNTEEKWADNRVNKLFYAVRELFLQPLSKRDPRSARKNIYSKEKGGTFDNSTLMKTELGGTRMQFWKPLHLLEHWTSGQGTSLASWQQAKKKGENDTRCPSQTHDGGPGDKADRCHALIWRKHSSTDDTAGWQCWCEFLGWEHAARYFELLMTVHNYYRLQLVLTTD